VLVAGKHTAIRGRSGHTLRIPWGGGLRFAFNHAGTLVATTGWGGNFDAGVPTAMVLLPRIVVYESNARIRPGLHRQSCSTRGRQLGVLDLGRWRNAPISKQRPMATAVVMIHSPASALRFTAQQSSKATCQDERPTRHGLPDPC
jgi:hypothetical protein